MITAMKPVPGVTRTFEASNSVFTQLRTAAWCLAFINVYNSSSK